jgi:hypothetical protein
MKAGSKQSLKDKVVPMLKHHSMKMYGVVEI